MIESPPDLRALVSDLSNSAWTLAAIGVLLETDLGPQLVEPRTVDELAAACPQVPRRRIAAVLDVARTRGVVIADGDRFRLAKGAVPVVCGPLRAAITADIRCQLMQPLEMLDGAPSGWAHTDTTILQTQGDASSMLPLMLKTQIAAQLGDLATRLERPGAAFLDVGTGVGSLAIATCRAYPQLRVVGLDVADAPLSIARANVARAGLAERVDLRKLAIQDLRDEAVFAFAWLPAFFIPEHVLPAAIARATAALEPGGWLLLGSNGGGDAKQAAVWGLTMESWGGPMLPPGGAETLLREAGLADVRTLMGPPFGPTFVAGART